MNKFSDDSSPDSGRGLLRHALRSSDTERPNLLGHGGRLARGSVGVMTFAPTLGLLGKFLSSASVFGIGIMAASSIFVGGSEAACTGNKPAGFNCSGSQSGNQRIENDWQTASTNITLKSNWVLTGDSTKSGSNDHGLIIKAYRSGGIRLRQEGTGSDTFSITAYGIGFDIIGDGGRTSQDPHLAESAGVDAELIRGVKSTKNIGVKINSSRGHIAVKVRNVDGNTGGIFAEQRTGNTNNRNMTITATHTVSTSTGKGVYAKKTSTGNLTLSLAAVTGGSSGSSGTAFGVDVRHTGGTGTATVTITGTITGRDYGLSANLTASGEHDIKTAAITSSGDGVRISATRQLTFSSSGTITANSGYGFSLSRGFGTSTGTVDLSFSNITSVKDGIYLYGTTASATTITTNGTISASGSGYNGIYLLNKGTGTITVNVKGDVQGGGKRNASPGPPSVAEKLGYAISVNAGTGSASNATSAVTVTVTSGTVKGTSTAGAILNGSGNSSITFSGSNATLSGDVKLGLGQDSLVISGSTVTAASELDGGQEAANSTVVDELTFRNGAKTTGTFLTLDPAKIKNWERINVSASTNWRILGTKTLTAANVSVSGTISLSEAAANSRAPDDALTISGNLIGGGTVVLDVNLATGSADTITITGNVTGATVITFSNVTPSNNTNRTASDITLITVQGTVSAGAFTSTTVPESTKYRLEFDSDAKTFALGVIRIPRCKTSEGGTVGTFVCSGTIDAPEIMSASGTTNLIATLNSSTTTVASSVSGVIFTMSGENGITFTQATGGGTLAATGSATGILDASTTGNGNIAVTLIGAASLAGSGTAVKVSSTGTGTITVSTNNVTANHSQAMAVNIAAAGTNVLLDAKGTIAGGIQVKNTHTTGTATVSAAAAVSKNSGTAIYAYGKGNLVEVKTSNTVTGSSSGVGGIKIVSKSAGAGALSVSAGGTVTASGGTGIHAEHDGRGALTITAAAVSASNNTPINVINRNSGDITLNISGAVTGPNSLTSGEGIKIVDNGPGDIEINTASVTGGEHGIYVDKNNVGSVEITVSGDITGRGTTTRDYAIGIKTNVTSSDIILNLSNHKITGGYGVFVYGQLSGDITVSSSGEIDAKQGGIYIYSIAAANFDVDVHTLTASGTRGIQIQAVGGGTATVTIASGGKVEGESYGVTIVNTSAGKVTLEASGAITGSNAIGAWINHSGAGAVELTTTSVTGGRQGFKIDKTGAGNVTLTATGTISTTSSASHNALEANVTGDGNVLLTLAAVTGTKNGVFVKNVGSGTLTISGNGAITATGSGDKDAGIYAYTNASGGAISITVSSTGSVSGKYGIRAESKSSANVTITTSGAVTGTSDDGISAMHASGTIAINVSSNVTGASNKTAIDATTNASGNSLITIHSGTVTAAGATGKAIVNGAGPSAVVIHSSASVTADIALGAGVDVLTFSGGTNFSRTITIDGGEDSGTDSSTDQLNINSISSLLDASKLTNWEVISFGTGTTGRFNGTVTLNTDELKVPRGAILSLKDEAPGDTLTIAGDFTGGGAIHIDINLATGAKDSIVVQGDISGVTTIVLNDKTPSNAVGRQESIELISFTGTSTDNAISFPVSLVSQGYSYSIELENKKFNLAGRRTNLLCVEDTNTEGTFACAGTINTSENMVETGTTNIVATLANNATVSVSAFIALYMFGANAITFTQAANGGSINGTGNATGAVKAKTTGNGNIQMTLTGTATLAGAGTAVFAESTGTGSISITTQKVTASNASGRGIRADGKAAITISANDEITGGIEVNDRGLGGTVSISTSSTVSSNNNDGIHVKRHQGGGTSASVEVNTSGAVTGKRHGIYINDVTGVTRSGTVTVNATGAITATDNRGISIDINYGTSMPVTIVASGAISSKRRGIMAWHKGAGAVSITANNTVTSTDSDGIYAYTVGDDITINTTSAVTGGLFGIAARHWGNQSSDKVTVSASAAINGRGKYGLYVRAKRGQSLSATVAAVTGKEHGIKTKGVVGAISLTASGAIVGTDKDGINIESTGSSISLTFSSTVTGGESGIVVNNQGGGAGAVLINASGAVTGTSKAGINVQNSRVGATTITATSTVSGSSAGIVAKGTGSGASAVTVSAVGTVSASAGVAIDAYGKGASVTISTSTTVTGSGSTTATGSVGGIKAVNKSSGAGTVSITLGGKVTTTGGTGIHAENEGTGGLTITAGEIASNGAGIVATNSNSGTLTLNISGAITQNGSGDTRTGDGIKATNNGADDLVVNTMSVTGSEDGIDLNKTAGGSITLTISGAITANGDSNDQAGIAAINDSEGEDITLNLSNHSVTGGYHGIYVYNEGDGNIAITSTGTITGSGKHGVYVNQEGSAVNLSLHTVSGKEYGLQLKHYGDGTATITLSTGGRASGGETGVFLYGQGDGDISLVASGTIRGSNSDGLYVYQSGDAAVTISVASVSGKSDGIDLRKYGSGNVSITATGTVQAARGSEQDGLEALSSGAGNISITVASVTGYADGIDVRNYVGGTIDLNVNGAVVGNGTGASHTGIYAYADEDAGNITISVGSAGSVSGRFGISASSESSGNITISTSGAVTGTVETGIEAEVQDGEISITISGNVTGSSSKVAIDTKSTASGTTTIVINSGIIAASGGTSIQNNGGTSDITINSGATINQKISLGGGVDKLTFVGKAPATTLEIDGGEDSGTDTSVDVLTFSGFTGSVSATQLKNWETIAVAAGTTITFTGSQSLSVETLTLSGGVVSLSDDNVGDSLAISGNIGGRGSLGIDVNLSSGASDTFTVTKNLTGTHRLIVKDVTPANQTTRVTQVKVVSVGGTTSSPSLTLQNRFRSGGFAYSLEYNASEKAFFLLGERSTLNCIESTTNPGNYTCRGNFSLSENILGDGSEDLVAVLDASAVVNVGAAVAMSLEGAGSITFTQAAGGGWINATGDATGVIHAKTSGSGSINISLTGTANLIASGTAILVDSTGTGSITVSTNHVTANNSDATAINLMGSGDSITLHTQSGVSGGKAGIIVKNVSSTGTVTISASTDVASSSGTAIYAYGKGASVTVSTGGQALGNAMGIKAVNKSTGSGSLTVSAGNSVRGSSNTGIYATNSGQGGLAITAGAVGGGKAGIDARNYTSGNLTINVTGAVNVPDTAGDDGINAYNKGAGDVTVSTVAVTGDASGVDIRNYGGGSITASFGGTIVATGSGTGDAGVVLINDAQGSDITATITSAGSIRGQHGIRGVHNSSGAFLVNASGTISGSSEDGINVTGGTAGSITLNVGEVSAAKRAIVVTNTGAGSVAVTATGTVKTNATVTAVGALSIVNSGSTTLTLSAVQATETAVYVNSTGLGSSTITLNGAVSTSGDGAVHGIYTKAGTRAGDTAITVPTGGGVTGKSTAIKAVSAGSGSITIVTSGNLSSTHKGLDVSVAERGNISLNVNNDVSVTDSAAVGIDTGTRSGATTIVIGGGTIGGATSIRNNAGDSTVTVNKGVELSGNIELGGGVDKLTFNESFDSTITIDGGQDSGINRSKDVIAIESGKASIDLTKLRNWEIIQVGSSGTIAFEGTQNLTVEQVMLAGTLSLKNESIEDAFTLTGNLVPHGTNNVGVLELDVDFSVGDKRDTITVSGDVTGSYNITLYDVTPSDKTDRFLNRINILTVGGTSSESSFSLTGTRFASGGYLYKLNYDDQARIYYLTGERGTLKCESSSEGVFACAGSLVFPENIRTIGDTAVTATLSAGSTVNVTVGVAIQMTSQNSISFTQASSGQPLNASGNATGVVHASNTGRGDVSITLTGTATLDGAGTGVAARSTGTGNVNVTTAGVAANHGSATAIRASGLGAQVSVNASAVSAGRNGIIVTNRSNGGTSTVVTTGAVTSSGTGVYAFSLSGNVNVNAVGVAGGTSAIVAKNDGGSGNVSVTTTGVVTGSAGAIQVYNYGIGSLNVLASNQVTGRASDGISVIAGASTTSISVSAASSTGQRNAIRVENSGTATASVTVSGNTVGNRGSAIHVENDGSGDINIIASSQVTGGPQGTGIETRTNGGDTKITLNAGALVSGASGFAIRNDEGDSEISIRAGATVSGRVELGGGVDRLTFADATFGTSILNGGSDTGADVSVDVLTINGGAFVLSEDNFVNWESIVFGSQTNISVNGVSAITTGTLTVQGTLSMQDEVTNDTLTIDGNLVGGGTIKIDTDFFTGSTDSLTVSGNVTGRTTIEVNDISPSSGGQDQEAINIVTVTGASTTVSFSLADGGFTGGAYQYELEFLPSTRQYVLSKKQSVGSVMLVAAPIALIDGFAKLPSLHERRSIDSTQSNWSRVIGNTNSYGKAPADQAEYESQTTGLQAGFDFAKQTTPTGTWVYGFTAQFNSLNTDIKVASTEGELMADGYGVGATATWVGLNGGYLDIQAQYNQMTIDFDVAGTDTSFIEGQDATAMAISMELGKSHSIGENLTLLTNGQISWGLADIGDVKSTSGQPIVFGDDANITARFGMRLEYNEEPYKLHLLTNLYYDTLETWEATFANATYRDSKDPVSLELGLGGSMKLSPNSNLFMQGGFRKTTDDEFEQRDSAHFTTGVRWSW